MEEGSSCEMEMVQLRGVTSTGAHDAELGANAKLCAHEKCSPTAARPPFPT